MLAVSGTWEVLRAIGAHALRGLAALEPRGWNRQAQRNAASAAVLAREWRLEAVDLDRQAVGRAVTADPTVPVRVRASGG